VDLNQPRLEFASRIRPCQGEYVSGDAIVIREFQGGLLAAIVDVLGHGREANDLALVIERYLEQVEEREPASVMKGLHEHIRGSRGAAIGLCSIDAESGRVSYVGTGNTVLRRFGKQETRLVSQDGILGQNMRTPRCFDLALEEGDLLLLYTDGVKDRFGSKDYPGVFNHPPEEVVNSIIDRFSKNYDDAGCIAIRYLA
jgi:negative regulator of sigma-B (phosphoserine phosphatase)